MRNAYIVLLVLLITSLVQGCAYYSYSTRTAYGVQKVDIEEYLGPIDIGYDSPILSPVITFDNGVQVKFYISGAYNYPPKKTDSEYFNNARIEMFITSLKQGIQLNTKSIILDQYRIGKKIPVKFIELKRYPSLAKNQHGLLVCSYPELSQKAFYDFYKKESIEVPYMTNLKLELIKGGGLMSNYNILCGELVAMDTDFSGEQGYFTITLPFIEAGNTKEYTVHFYPVGTRYTIK